MKLGELMSQLINILEDEDTAALPVTVAIGQEDVPLDRVYVEQMVNGQRILFIEGQA